MGWWEFGLVSINCVGWWRILEFLAAGVRNLCKWRRNIPDICIHPMFELEKGPQRFGLST